MPSRLWFWSFTASLAGFLFGFDTVVVSGAEKRIQSLWNLSDELHGVVIGAALWGTVLGSLVGGWPADRFGRRRTLLWIGLVYLVSAVWSALADGAWSLAAARLLGGIGIGVCTVAAPMYISEIAPPRLRGRLTGLFQFNIVFGILVAFLSNSLLSGIGEDAWRWMLGVVAVPAVVYSLLCLAIPESPRWLIAQGRDWAAGRKVLRQIDPAASNEEVEALADEIAASTAGTSKAEGFWTARLQKPILLAFAVAFFNQLSGINAILYFAPRIFELAGFGEKDSLTQSILIGVTNLVFTFVGLWLIDRLGRRTLLTIGSFGYIASLGACAAAFFAGRTEVVPYAIFAFIAAHAVGQGAVIWVFIAEIFPTAHRAAGQSLGSATHWVFAATLATAFPKLVTQFPPGAVFLFFAGMMVAQLVWVRLLVPETKGVPLEEIERKLGTK